MLSWYLCQAISEEKQEESQLEKQNRGAKNKKQKNKKNRLKLAIREVQKVIRIEVQSVKKGVQKVIRRECGQ